MCAAASLVFYVQGELAVWLFPGVRILIGALRRRCGPDSLRGLSIMVGWIQGSFAFPCTWMMPSALRGLPSWLDTCFAEATPTALFLRCLPNCGSAAFYARLTL